MNKLADHSKESQQYSVVIPAGGNGQRMFESSKSEQTSIAKQFLSVQGKTIL